jgi:hypothetical protein
VRPASLNPSVEMQGTVVSDQNAASDYVRFLHPRQWQVLDFDAIYSMDWRHPNDRAAFFRHRSQKCAEVLIPHVVTPNLIAGAYVLNEAVMSRVDALGLALPLTANRVLFFQ